MSARRWATGMIVLDLCLLLAGIGATVGILTGCASEEEQQPAWGDDVDARVLAQYRAYGPQHILLVGDSLTDFLPLTELCGLPVIRAGYSGGKWSHVAARTIWSQLNSRAVVVQLGTNNALKGPTVGVDEMQAFLTRLQTDYLAVETIPPFFDPDYVTPEHLQFLAEIQANVLTLGFPSIDSREVMQNPALYVDGIHWNSAGYAVQTQLLTEAVCAQLAQG